MKKTPAANPWPLFLALIGAAFLLLTLWSVHQAHSGGSAVLDRDYYRRGVEYDRGGAAAGWRLRATSDGAVLRAAVVDGSNRPVTGGRGRIRFVAGGGEIEAREVAPGVYEAVLPASGAGAAVWLSLRRDDVLLERRLLVAAGG